GYWLDAHSGHIDADLAMMAADIVADLPNLGAIIFEIAADRVTDFGEAAFLREMETLNRLWDRARPAAVRSRPPAARPPAITGPMPSPEGWERLLAAQLLPAAYRLPGAGQTIQLRSADEQSFALYSRLAASFRRGAIADVLENTVRLLLIALGKDALANLLDAYTHVTPPSLFPSDEALAFKRFIDRQMPAVPGLADVLGFEAALIEAVADNRTIQVALACDLGALLDAIAAGRSPEPGATGPACTIEIGADPQPFVRLAANAT